MKLVSPTFVVVLLATTAHGQVLGLTSTSILPALTTNLPIPVSTDIPLALSSLSSILPPIALLPTTSAVASSTVLPPAPAATSQSSSPSSFVSGSIIGSAIALASNTASGFGSSSTPIPDPNGGAGVSPVGAGLNNSNNNNNSSSGANVGAGNNGFNGTNSNATGTMANSGGGANAGPTNNMIASLSPATLYTAIVTQQISLPVILSVITTLSAQQIQAVQNAVTAQQASLQTCYAPVVCLTNPSRPGQLAGGTLVVSTLNGQSTTFQIPAGSGSSGSANYIVTSSGAGTLANAAAALQSMSTLPASSGAGMLRMGYSVLIAVAVVSVKLF